MRVAEAVRMVTEAGTNGKPATGWQCGEKTSLKRPAWVKGPPRHIFECRFFTQPPNANAFQESLKTFTFSADQATGLH